MGWQGLIQDVQEDCCNHGNLQVNEVPRFDFRLFVFEFLFFVDIHFKQGNKRMP